MQAISIAANNESIFIHLDRNAVTTQTISETVAELHEYLQTIVTTEQQNPGKQRQDISFIYHLPTVNISDERIIEKYKHSTFSREEIYEDTERDNRLYGGVQ